MIVKGIFVLFAVFIIICVVFQIGLIIRFFCCVLPKRKDCQRRCPMAFMCTRTHYYAPLTPEEKERIRKYIEGEETE